MAWVGQEKLYKAVIAALRADTGAGGLVPLTGYTAANISIGREMPIVVGRTPFLAVRISRSTPLVGVDVTKLQQATLEFHAIDTSELTAIQIADRLEELLHASDDNTSYWNPSNTDISCRQSRFRNRVGPMHDEDTDTWDVLVEASLIWVGTPCPAI
jgi:hypothetical protein